MVRAATAADEPVAVISAGWQEAEGDIEELHTLIERPLVDLMLYRRAEEVMNRTPVLQQAGRWRQEQLQELQRLYRLRLKHLLRAARAVLGGDGNEEMLKLETRHAISQVRALDRHHLRRLRGVHDEYAGLAGNHESDVLDGHIDGLSAKLAQVSTVVITGGNLPVLLNRLRLFGMESLLDGKHIVAWSAGAMALAERIVLFHDNAPQGRRDAEIFDYGLGLTGNFVWLPDARRRLQDNRQTRLALFSRRFAPARCITLDNGTQVELDGDRVVKAHGAQSITRRGKFSLVRGR